VTSPIRASALLTTASRLARGPGGAGRPALADLRRGTSTAYYALFHQILRHATLHVLPDGTEDDVANVSRWFTHAGVLRASKWVVAAARTKKPSKDEAAAVRLLRRDPSQPIPSSLLQVAEAFIDLQGARHEADYSNDYDPVRFTTINHVDIAEAAVKEATSLWNGRQSATAQRRDDFHAYGRFLLLCLSASGGPQSRA
jgi:hypothetical protein